MDTNRTSSRSPPLQSVDQRHVSRVFWHAGPLAALRVELDGIWPRPENAASRLSEGGDRAGRRYLRWAPTQHGIRGGEACWLAVTLGADARDSPPSGIQSIMGSSARRPPARPSSCPVVQSHCDASARPSRFFILNSGRQSARKAVRARRGRLRHSVASYEVIS